jgi:hypothetical protein
VESEGLEGCNYKKNDINSTTILQGEYSKPYTAETRDSSKTLKLDYTGFTSGQLQTGYTDTIPQITGLHILNNSNKFKVTQSGPTFVPYTPGENCILYYSSNMNNYSLSRNLPVEYDENYEGKQTIATGITNTSTITGYRKYFYGGYLLTGLTPPVTYAQVNNWIQNTLTGDMIRKSVEQGGLGLVHSTNKATTSAHFDYEVHEETDTFNLLVVAVDNSFDITIFDVNQNHNLQPSDGLITTTKEINSNNGYDHITYKVCVFFLNNLNTFITNTFQISFN